MVRHGPQLGRTAKRWGLVGSLAPGGEGFYLSRDYETPGFSFLHFLEVDGG